MSRTSSMSSNNSTSTASFTASSTASSTASPLRTDSTSSTAPTAKPTLSSSSPVSTKAHQKTSGIQVNNRKKFLSHTTSNLLLIQKNKLKKERASSKIKIKTMQFKIKKVEEKLKKKPNDDEYCRRWERVHYALTKQLEKYVLEKQFPTSMRWMLRIVVPPPDDLYIGIRDFNIEKLDADIGVTLGHNHEILFNVTNVHCIASLYKLKLNGPSLLGKALNQLISSRRIDIEVTGSWVLPLKHGLHKNSKIERWDVDWKRAHFKLNLIKSVSGNATLKLPATVVNWILNTILPGLISNAIIVILPNAIAPLINSGTNTASFNGSISVVGEISTEDWRAPFVKSERARRLLNISLEEALLLEQICTAADRGRAVGLKSNASCASLLKWRLSLASFPMEELEPILYTLQQGLLPKLCPGGGSGELDPHWLSNLLRELCELAQKPLTVSVQIHAPLRLECSLWEVLSVISKIYLDVERQKERKKVETANAANAANVLTGSTGATATTAATSVEDGTLRRRKSSVTNFDGFDSYKEKEIHTSVEASIAMTVARQSILDVQNVMSTLLDLMNDITLTLSTIVAGGEGGVLGIRIDDLDADLQLPQNPFQLLSAPMIIGQTLDASWTRGEHGPGEDEYTIKMMEVSNEAWDLKETNGDDSLCREALTKDAAVEVVVGAARVDLFPRFSFGGDKSKGHLRKKKKDNSTIRHRSSMYSRHSAANNKDGSKGRKGSTNSYDSGSDNDGGKEKMDPEHKTTTTTTTALPSAATAATTTPATTPPRPKKGAIRARAASVRVTVLLRLLIDAIRVGAQEAEAQSRIEAVRLARVVRARSDSRNNSGQIVFNEKNDGSGGSSGGSGEKSGPSLSSASSKRPKKRRTSSGGSLIVDTAILEALNVADVLLPYIEDTERALHFQLNNLILKINGTTGNIVLTNVVKVTENGVTVQREGDSKSSCLNFRMRVTAGEFIKDIMTLAMDGVS